MVHPCAGGDVVSSAVDAVVVGGGWAGLAAATRLVQRGAKVILLERAKELGGRASSFYDHDFGEWLDNGPHIFVGAYRTALGLLNTWGAGDGISFNDGGEIPFIYPGGREITLKITSIFSFGRIDAAAGLMTFRGMSIGERFKTLRAARVMMKMTDIDPQHEVTVADFLLRFGIRPGECGGFWDMLTVAVMNAPTKLVGLKPLAQALKEGLLGGGGSGRLGIPLKPFKQLYIEPAKRFLAESGVEIRFGEGVKKVLINRRDRVIGVETSRGKIDCDRVILAIPPSIISPRFPAGDERGGLLPSRWLNNSFFTRFRDIRFSPIASVHLTFDRPVMQHRFVCLPEAFTHWVFGRGEPDADGWSRLSTITSFAPGKDEMTEKDIRRWALTDLHERLPETRKSEVRHMRVVRTIAAAMLLEPGSELIRPTVRTPVNGLYLAGDWCATGLPATIESAARAGAEAAEELSIHQPTPKRLNCE